jgi:large subunit ribosomal protein L22
MKATVRYLRITPRKVRLVADMIRGKNVEEALNLLQFTSKSSAKPLARLVKSAVANADQKGGVNVDKLVVAKVWADGGPVVKRFMPRAMGRATPILHRTSHVTVELEERS